MSLTLIRDLRYLADRRRRRTVQTLAWLLPEELVYWCYIRVVANATTGKYGGTEMPALDVIEALDRWMVGEQK